MFHANSGNAHILDNAEIKLAGLAISAVFGIAGYWILTNTNDEEITFLKLGPGFVCLFLSYRAFQIFLGYLNPFRVMMP